MSKEAIELVKKVKSDLWDYTSPNVNVKNEKLSEDIELLNQVLAILEGQPNCEGCEFFKHTDKFHHCWRYTEETSLCKLRQEPVEQPSTSEFLKGCRDLRKKGVTDEQWEYATKLGEACKIIDRSETSRKELLTACEAALEFIGRSNKTDWNNEITPILEAAIKANKQGD